MLHIPSKKIEAKKIFLQKIFEAKKIPMKNTSACNPKSIMLKKSDHIKVTAKIHEPQDALKLIYQFSKNRN